MTDRTTDPTTPLSRLAELLRSTDALTDELAVNRASITAARSYLDRPGCNARFGQSHLERCRDRHSGLLARLRANRIEALHLMGGRDMPVRDWLADLIRLLFMAAGKPSGKPADKPSDIPTIIPIPAPSPNLPERTIPMATPQEIFTSVVSDDATVVADRAKLDTDSAKAVSDHAGLVDAVKVPTLVKLADGTPVALIPKPDGTLENLVLSDGSVAPAVDPTPVTVGDPVTDPNAPPVGS